MSQENVQTPGQGTAPVVPNIAMPQVPGQPAPVAPVAPVMPVAQPGQSVAPVAPVAHAMPVQEVAPVAQVAQVDPAAQVAPIAHVEPVAPVAPAMPVQEVAPVAPVAPAMPVQEVAPVAPVAPAQEVAQVAPVQEVPAQPTMPAMPVENIVVSGADIMPAPGTQGGIDLNAGVMSPEDAVELNQAQKEVVPISVGGLQPIATCKSSAWGAFLKVLDFLAKDSSKDEVIMVEQGTLDTNKNGVFVHCDLKNVLGDVTLNITSPSYSTKLLKTIKGGEFVQILKEEATNSYVFCNIVDGRMFTKVRTKFAAGDIDSFAKPPVLAEPIYQKEVSASDKEIIKTIIEGKSAIESDEPYRFGFSKVDNSLVSIGVGKDFTHYFQDSNIEIDEFKVYYPFPVSRMDSCIIKFFKEADGSTWLKTVNNVELASIICTEKIEIVDSSIEDFTF